MQLGQGTFSGNDLRESLTLPPRKGFYATVIFGFVMLSPGQLQ